MKTKLFAVLILSACSAGLARAADDPFASIRTALDHNQLEVAEAALVPMTLAPQPDAHAWLLLSQVRLRQEQTKEAVDCAEKAVASAPDRAECHSNLGRVLGQRVGEVSFDKQGPVAMQMLAAFRKSIELDPNHVPGYIGLSRYFTNAPEIAGGSRETAEYYARELEKRHQVLGTIELATIAEHFNDPAQAYARFTEAATAQPDAAWIQEALGRVSEKLQHPAEARTHYEKALVLDPQQAASKEALARLAEAKG